MRNKEKCDICEKETDFLVDYFAMICQELNAGFNIAELHQLSISQFSKESDLLKGNTDIPKEAMVLKSN